MALFTVGMNDVTVPLADPPKFLINGGSPVAPIQKVQRNSFRMSKATFVVGQRVQVKRPVGLPGYDLATIVAKHDEDGTFDVEFSDGLVQERVKDSRVTNMFEEREKVHKLPCPLEQTRPVFTIFRASKALLNIGQSVRVKRPTGVPGFEEDGIIVAKYDISGTFDIEFSDGHLEQQVSAARVVEKPVVTFIQPAIDEVADINQHYRRTSKFRPSKANLHIGQHVLVKKQGFRPEYNGGTIVAKYDEDATFDIEYLDGVMECHVKEFRVTYPSNEKDCEVHEFEAEFEPSAIKTAFIPAF